MRIAPAPHSMSNVVDVIHNTSGDGVHFQRIDTGVRGRIGLALRSSEPRTPSVYWLTANAARVPTGCVHIDPDDALEVLDELDEPVAAARSAVVIDTDGLDPFDVADRMHLCVQARKASRFVRITQ